MYNEKDYSSDRASLEKGLGGDGHAHAAGGCIYFK